MGDDITTRVYRPPASKVWTASHRWGSMGSDTTELRVVKYDDGRVLISSRGGEVETRKELVDALAEMIAEAHVWADTGVKDPE